MHSRVRIPLGRGAVPVRQPILREGVSATMQLRWAGRLEGVHTASFARPPADAAPLLACAWMPGNALVSTRGAGGLGNMVILCVGVVPDARCRYCQKVLDLGAGSRSFTDDVTRWQRAGRFVSAGCSGLPANAVWHSVQWRGRVLQSCRSAGAVVVWHVKGGHVYMSVPVLQHACSAVRHLY